MKKILLLLCLLAAAGNLFSQDSIAPSRTRIYKALALYPIQKQLGYRSNLTRKWFTDFKGGMTFSALPFFVLELNRNCRFVNKENVSVYSGIGVTFDSYVPGMQVPFGIEVAPLEKLKQLSVIAEVKPKLSFGPTNFLNISFSPHLGIAYYFKQKAETR